MISLLVTVALGTAPQAQSMVDGSGKAVAQRLLAAIEGESGFVDSDFVKPLREREKIALQRVSVCKIKYINYTGAATSGNPMEYKEDPNSVAMVFRCKGVSEDTPVGISLQLAGGKVQKIETHSFDLLRSN